MKHHHLGGRNTLEKIKNIPTRFSPLKIMEGNYTLTMTWNFSDPIFSDKETRKNLINMLDNNQEKYIKYIGDTVVNAITNIFDGFLTINISISVSRIEYIFLENIDLKIKINFFNDNDLLLNRLIDFNLNDVMKDINLLSIACSE